MEKYTREQIFIIHSNMKKYGGGFISTLSECIIKADKENLQKIQSVFIEEFEKYLNI